MTDYQDTWIGCDAEGVTVRGYYFPWGSRRIRYEDVVDVERRDLTGWTGRLRIWGTGDPRYWFNLDPRRPRKQVGFVLDVGTRVHPVLTPDDPAGFAATLRQHGVRLAADLAQG